MHNTYLIPLLRISAVSIKIVVEEIVKGFKSKITMDEAMTGKEFCELLEINYDKIVEMRTVDQSKNLAYFVQNLFCIKAVQDLLDR